jgi:hypothetical protein
LLMGRERRRSTSNACPSDRCERAGVGEAGGPGVGAAAGGEVGEATGPGEAAGSSRLGSWAATAAADASMNADRRTGDLKRSGAHARAQES